mgnify:CR=1 FL=1
MILRLSWLALALGLARNDKPCQRQRHDGGGANSPMDHIEQGLSHGRINSKDRARNYSSTARRGKPCVNCVF